MKEHLLESVDKKEYFDKAIEWYCSKHLSCYIERSCLLFVASFLSTGLCILLFNIYLLFPIQKDLNFVRYMNRADDESYAVKRLGFAESSNEHSAVLRYLLTKYVELYESYNIFEISYRGGFIKNNSTVKVYQKFQNKINNDINSSKAVNVKVAEVNISIDQSTLGLVAITGNATVKFTIQQNKINKDHTAKIDFSLSNIKTAMSGISPFKFIVSNYKLI